MKQYLFIIGLLLWVSFFSCEKPPAPMPTERTTLHMDQEDEVLLRIAKYARDTSPVFFRHMLRPAKDEKNFRVKYPFRADWGSGFSMEQIWLSDIKFKNGVYYGIVDNHPFYTNVLKKGDSVSFNTEDITDWMYTSNDKIIGAYSIKYLLDQLPERSDQQNQILNMLSELPADL